jgi:hypothetical protein
MKQAISRIARRGVRPVAWALGALGATALSGCAFGGHTARMAVDYNDFVAQTTNRQTVINVLRASHREPMHFTSFSEVVGTIRGTGTVGTTTAINGDSSSRTQTSTNTANSTAAGANGGAITNTLTDLATEGATNVTPNLALTVVTGTDFKVAANTTDEFYKGILNPISPAVLVSYLRQGFPADLLSHLAIGRLEFRARVVDLSGTEQIVDLATYENNPDNPNKIKDFDAAIQCRTLDYNPVPFDKAPIEAATLSAFGPLTPDLLNRVESIKDGKGGIVYRLSFPKRTDFSLALSKPNEGRCDRTRPALKRQFEAWTMQKGLHPRTPAEAQASQPATARGIEGKLSAFGRSYPWRDDEDRTRISSSTVQLGGDDYFTSQLPMGYRGDLIIDVTLRSVEGMIYYLGEYIRVDTAPVKLKSSQCGPEIYCVPIIRVRPKAEIPESERFVEVDYRGATYAAPISGLKVDAIHGRSSQTVSLIQQLLNLNRSAKDMPSTPLVRVYN